MLRKFAFVVMLLLLVVVLSALVGVVQSQASELPPLTEPGPYGVSLMSMAFVDPNREDWTLDTLIWYPADKTNATPAVRGGLVLRDAPPDRSGAPYPLIIYSHGWTGNNAESSPVMEYLASQGYIVAAPQHHDTVPWRFEKVDRPLDLMVVLDALAAVSDADLVGMIDTTNVGLIGYDGDVLQMLGLGGAAANFTNWCAEHPELKTWDCNPPADYVTWDFNALSAYRAQLGLQDLPDGTWAPFGDERIHAVIAVGACDFTRTTEDMLAAVTTPTMILYGTQDPYCDYEGNAVSTYTHLGTDDRYLISLVNGSTNDFVTHPDVPLHFATAFFGDYLKADESYAPYLTPEGLPTFGRLTLAWGPYEGE